jgi:exocyst complex component 1
MHYFGADMAQMEVGSVAGFIRRAQVIYQENLNAYIKLILRRPFAKLIVSQ